MTIYIPWNENFGDQWQTLSLMARRADITGQHTRLSRWQHDRDLGKLHDDIRAVMVSMSVYSIDLPGDTPLEGYDVWACEPWPTTLKWNHRRVSNYAVYQLDGLSTPELKNPSAQEASEILAIIRNAGYEAVPIGKHYGVAKSVELAAGAAFFVGVDSGMSHLCHSVGVPVFLLQYQLPVVTCHRGKAYRLCEGAKDFADKLDRWLHYRDFCGILRRLPLFTATMEVEPASTKLPESAYPRRR